MMTSFLGWAGAWAALALATVMAGAAPAEARTTEVHLVLKVDLQRVQRTGPPDEPLEPAPSLEQKVRGVVAAHPAFQGVSAKVVSSESAPSPRVPADFLRLVNHGVDDVVVVQLDYHLRLDNFRASGTAGARGFVSVYSVAGRRKVVSRPFTVTVSYPGEVTREAVIQAELAARARGTAVPVEEVELGLLDGAVKQRLDAELQTALAVYRPGALPRLSKEAVQESTRRMAQFLAASPDRRAEAIQLLEEDLRRHRDTPQRAELEQRLRRLKLAAGREPGQDAERQQERAAARVSQSVTAAQLAELFEKLVGSVVEVRAFRLDWRDDTVVLAPVNRNQDFVIEQVPPRIRELETDPSPIYVLVVGRRPDPVFVDVKIPVVRWIGCPKTACGPGP